MKLNVWKITEVPKNVIKINTKGNRNLLSNLNRDYVSGYIMTKGVVNVIGDLNKISATYQVQHGEFKDLSQEHQIKLLYHIIDSKIIQKGFKIIRRQRVFFLPKSSSTTLLRTNTDKSIYVNIGFKYSITTLYNRLLIVFNPFQIITKDGENYLNTFAQQNNPKVLEDSNLKPKYDFNIKILNTIISLLGKDGELSFDFYDNGKLKLVESNNIEPTIIQEPQIDFGNGNFHTWAKNGLSKFHPLDYNEGHQTKPDGIKLALIGTKQSFDLLKVLSKGETKNNYPFKGFKNIYKTDLIMGEDRFIELTDSEIDSQNSTDEIVELIMTKIVGMKNQQIEYDVCLVELGPKWELFFNNQSKDLHDLIKISAWKNKSVTQLFTKKTNTNIGTDKLNNIALGIYYKSGGNPWRLKTNFVNTAYVGVSFGYSELDKKRLIGVAEIFDNYGQFISLRSVTIKEVPLESRIEEKRDVHLSTEQLVNLIKNLLSDYSQSLDGSLPENLIIHKTTYFNKFEKASLKALTEFPINYSFIHLQKDHSWNIISSDGKEPIRGTFFRLNNNKALLYTSGLLSNQKKYYLPGSPRPYIVNLESESNFTIKQICLQVLELTKLNFNSTNTYSKEPVTLLHSRDIVDLLRAGLDPINIPSDPRYFL